MTQTVPIGVQGILQRYRPQIIQGLHQAVAQARQTVLVGLPTVLQPFYGQMEYHLGWVDQNFEPVDNHPGKLLRPVLLLLTYEFVRGKHLSTDIDDDDEYTVLEQVLPAALAVEMLHNFTLLHDDIEDADVERRHRATVWKLWGIPQAINTGDGMLALARLILWNVYKKGVAADVVVKLGEAFDRTLLLLTEGQHLDMSFEDQVQVSLPLYTEMISRKTAALMSYCTEVGASLGTQGQDVIGQLQKFGWCLGMAFQVRDDILGVWASNKESGKTFAGDIYRRKKSLPFLHALQYSNQSQQERLKDLYQQKEALTFEQVQEVLAIFEKADSKKYCQAFLNEQCELARQQLINVPLNIDPARQQLCLDLHMLIDFIQSVQLH